MDKEQIQQNARRLEMIKNAVEQYSRIFTSEVNFRVMFDGKVTLTDEQAQVCTETLTRAKQQITELANGLLPGEKDVS